MTLPRPRVSPTARRAAAMHRGRTDSLTASPGQSASSSSSFVTTRARRRRRNASTSKTLGSSLTVRPRRLRAYSSSSSSKSPNARTMAAERIAARPVASRERGRSAGAEHGGGAAHVRRCYPEDRAEHARPGGHRLRGHDVDLGAGQLLRDPDQRTDAILAGDQQDLLRPGELPALPARDRPEPGGILGDEVDLRAPARRESRQGEEVDSLLLQDPEHARRFTRSVRGVEVEVLRHLDRLAHVTPPTTSNGSPIMRPAARFREGVSSGGSRSAIVAHVLVCDAEVVGDLVDDRPPDLVPHVVLVGAAQLVAALEDDDVVEMVLGGDGAIG